MPKFLSDGALDAGSSYIRNRATRQILCSNFPTTYLEATSTFALADVAVNTSHFTIADDPVSGRSIVAAEQNSVLGDATGEGDHMAWVNDTASVIEAATELETPLVVAEGSLIQFEAVEVVNWQDPI